MTKIKKDKRLYTIGEAAKICDVSKKTLLYYDELGIITPDEVDQDTGYRYYTKITYILKHFPKI